MNPTHSFQVEGPGPKKGGGAVPFAPGSGLLTFNGGEGQEATALIHPNTTVTRYQGKDWRKIGIGVTIGVFLAILIAVAVAFHSEHPEHGILGPSGQENSDQEGGSQTLPEPVLNKDYLGHPRALSTQWGGGMVAADHWICSATGRDVLKEGGHAVDAAVATALCLGVLSPYSSGVGGGLMMVIKSGVNESFEVINAREPAPAAASRDMFKGMSAEASQDGGLAIAVPIELKGLELAWSRHGRLPWQRLVRPAAALARNGYKAYPQLVRVLSEPEILTRVKRFPSLAEIFLKPVPVKSSPTDAGSRNVSDPSSKDGPGTGSKDGVDAGSDASEQGPATDWRPPRFGEHCCKQTKLADTLDAIGQHGVQWLYGSAERLATLAQEIQAAGGIVTEADLVFAQPLVEDVLRVQAGSYLLHVPPPPSSAAVMTLAFRILATLGLPFSPSPPTPPSPSPSPSPNPPPSPSPPSAPPPPSPLPPDEQQQTPFSSPPPPAPSSNDTPDLQPSPSLSPPPAPDFPSPTEQGGSTSPPPPFAPPPSASGSQSPADQPSSPTPLPSTSDMPPSPTSDTPSPSTSGADSGGADESGGLQSPADQDSSPAPSPSTSGDESGAADEGSVAEEGGDTGRRALASAIRNGDDPGEDLEFTFRLVEAMKHAFGARLALGDPGTLERPHADIKVAMDALLDPYFAESLRRMVESGSSVLDVHKYGGKLNPLEASQSGATPDDRGTTHLSVVDGEGNAVALTSTLNTEFGSCVVSPSTGIILNNQMDDFSRPDTPNSYGLQPSEANFIAGGKRPLSSMSPTIVTEAGQLRVVAGGSGGPRILSSTLQTLARHLLLRKGPLVAVSQPRVHHQLLPNVLKYEDFAFGSNLQFSVTNATLEYLASKGNALQAQATPGGVRYNLGVNQAIFVDVSKGVLTGVSDARKGGSPAACSAQPRSAPSQDAQSPPAAKPGRKLKAVRS